MNAGSIIATLRLRVDEFRNGLDEARNGLESVSSDFKKVGTASVAFGIALAVGLGSAVKVAANFESSMSRVGAVSGATDDEMKALTESAKKLGATTSFSASQAAEGMQYLAMAGFKTNEIIAAMPGVLNMAAAGNVALGDAANIASNIMSGFGLEASKAGHVSDVLAKTFTSSNTTLQGLGETFKYVAPAASAVGWKLEEMAAAAGKLGDVGIDASMAGTALRGAVTRLAAPTGTASKLLNQYNIELTDANGKMLPLADILGQMKTKFAGLTDAQRAAAVQTIFGTEAMSAMLALMEDPEGLRTFTLELEKAGGTSQRIADKQLDNFNGAMTKLGSAVEGAQISIGSAFIPALTALTGALNKVVDWFNGLSESTKQTIAIIAGLTAAFTLIGGTLLIFIGFIPSIIAGFGSLMTVVTTVTTAVKGFGAALTFLTANPFTLVIAGIAALVAAIVLIVKNWDTVKATTLSVWSAIQSFLTTTWNSITTAFTGTMQKLTSLATNACNSLRSGFTSALTAVSQTFSSMYSTVMGKLDSLVAGIRSKVQAAKQWLSELNPFKRHSPSLVDNVLAGVGVIKDTYKSISDMEIKPPSVGGLTPGRINVQGVVGEASGASGGAATNYNAPLVQVENMEVRNDQDVRSISSELYNLQRHADRARGR